MIKRIDKNLFVGICIILVFSIIIPVLLNFLLPLHITRVVGDETLWLGFWASFIGSIASFTVAFLTYRTLVHYKDSQLQNEKLEHRKREIQWLADLRHAMAELLNCCDISIMVELFEKIERGYYEDAVNESNRLIINYKKANFEVSSLLYSCENTALYGEKLIEFQKSTMDVIMSLRGVATNARYSEKDDSFVDCFKKYVDGVNGKPGFEIISDSYVYLENNGITLSPGSISYWILQLGTKDLDDRYNDVLDIYMIEANRVNSL